MNRDAAQRKALKIFGRRAFSCVQGDRYDWPPPAYSVGTSYMRDGAIHLAVKGAGKSWLTAFRDAAKTKKSRRGIDS